HAGQTPDMRRPPFGGLPCFCLIAGSAAAEPAPAAEARFLALVEEGFVVHDLALRVLLLHVPHVVVVVRHAAAQPRGLHQAPPGAAERLVLAGRDQRGAHYRSTSCGFSATYGVSWSVRTGERRAAAMV